MSTPEVSGQGQNINALLHGWPKRGNLDGHETKALFDRLTIKDPNTLRKEALPPTDRQDLITSVIGGLRKGTYIEIGFGYRPYAVGRTTREFTEESPYVGMKEEIVITKLGVEMGKCHQN